MSQADRKPDMPFDFSQFSGLGTGTWEQMSEASRKMLDTAATMSREIFDFCSARLSEDMAAQQKLLQSGSFEDMQKVYADFFQRASRQYIDQMQRLMTMATGSMTEAARNAARTPRK
jgi:hypothetical protein